MHQKPSDVRPGADAWALDAERQSDQGRAINAAIITDFNSFDQLIDLHLKDMREVGKPLARSKDYALRTLRKHLGKIKIASSHVNVLSTLGVSLYRLVQRLTKGKVTMSASMKPYAMKFSMPNDSQVSIKPRSLSISGS